ncbi:SpoIIE family protein phosphatase [Phenylobacterium sp. LjRoot225]|uniref:PP2C family protein-serine/threonine phosphatase n=1 Tax=Phenylobacterium sp. LjRoot225 TaxID=3342285 RepID=UPI003ED0E015
MVAERTTFYALPANADLSDRARAHCLEHLSGADAGRRVNVPDAGLIIGRLAPADLILPEADVSRAHCRLTRNSSGLVVTDLGSTNGTFVDEVRVTGSVALPVGAVLRIGTRILKHELLTERQLRKSSEMDREVAAATAYVKALLPPPLAQGPIRTDWCYVPSTQLGGDAFGYTFLDADRFAFYVIDVSGHGAGAALHAVSVMNVLRQRMLPGADMADPGSVLAALNSLFPMEQHADMYFTIWYGVYEATTRQLTYAAAGHHPAYLSPPWGDQATPLQARNPIIGAIPARQYRSESVTVAPGALIYLFSDGVFETVGPSGEIGNIDSFVTDFLTDPGDISGEAQRIFQAVTAKSRTTELDDDFSLVIVQLV